MVNDDDNNDADEEEDAAEGISADEDDAVDIDDEDEAFDFSEEVDAWTAFVDILATKEVASFADEDA